MEGQALQLSVEDQATQTRKSVSYHPSVWGDYFIANGGKASLHNQEASCELVSMRKRAEGLKDQEYVATNSVVKELKEQVRILFKDATSINLVHTMNLIDSIQLLGLDYHFEKEIKEALRQIYDANVDMRFGLHETALRFRLLRQEGYNVSPDVFNKFKDENKSFISSLEGDVKGLLSLYNAAYLRTHGETILDEAITFTRRELTPIVSNLEPPLAKQVLESLEIPLCRRLRRILARDYISIYKEESTKSDTILELAKLDYNILQSLHREEVKDVSIWWNEYVAPTKNFKFVRDRVVECYYWSLGVCYEPKFSRARLISSRVTSIVLILDDIYDLYSTLEESQLLTEAIERWDANAADELPEYMKQCYLMINSTFEQIEDMLESDEKYRMFYLKEMIKALTKGYLQENKWASKHYVAKLEEHLKVSFITTGHPTLICSAFVGMGEEATEEIFKWLIGFPTIVKASSIIGRILNDITSHEREQTREHVASTVQCYMKEYKTSVNVAYDKLRAIVEDAWKDINKERLSLTIPMSLLDIIVGYTRMVEVAYKDIDEFTESWDNTKNNISMLLVQPVPM